MLQLWPKTHLSSSLFDSGQLISFELVLQGGPNHELHISSQLLDHSSQS